MTHPSLKTVSARTSPKGGFTLVEILVVIAIIALLAGVALPAVTGALKKAKENAAMQTSHGLALAEFQYATDNDGTFPGKTSTITPATSSDIFQKELVPAYINNTDALFIAGGACTGKFIGTGNIDATCNAWDVVTHDDTTGMTSNDPDAVPIVMSTGSTVAAWGTAGTPKALQASISAGDSAKNPFGTDGLAIAHKDLSSAFVNSSNNGGTATAGFNITSASFDPATGYEKLIP